MTGSASVEAADVKNIAIEWAAGTVDISVVEDGGDAVELIESDSNSLTRSQKMRWSVSGGTLKIEYGPGFACSALGQKRLEVRIPQRFADAFGTVSVSGASGHYALAGFGCEELRLDLASGEIQASDVRADALDVDVASGQVRVEGRMANRVDVDVASGQVDVMCLQDAPSSVDAKLASGQVIVALPENDGFTAKVDALSGSFSSAFETTQQDGRYLYGDGGISVDVDMTSGTFRLEKSTR